MSPRSVVVSEIGTQSSLEMPRVEDHEMVQAVPADRPARWISQRRPLFPAPKEGVTHSFPRTASGSGFSQEESSRRLPCRAVALPRLVPNSDSRPLDPVDSPCTRTGFGYEQR